MLFHIFADEPPAKRPKLEASMAIQVEEAESFSVVSENKHFSAIQDYSSYSPLNMCIVNLLCIPTNYCESRYSC